MTGWPCFTQTAENGAAVDASTAVFCGIDASPPPSKVPGKRLRLETGAQIRREMTRVYREMRAGSLDPTRASKLIYALTELGRAVEREGVERLTERVALIEGR